jgi:hypothetical protein
MQVLQCDAHSFMPTQHCTTTPPKTSYCSNYMWGPSFKVTKGCCWYNTTINKHLHLKKPFAQNLCENNLMFHWERSNYVLYISSSVMLDNHWIPILWAYTHILNVTTMVLTLLFFFFVTFFLVFQKMGKFGIFFPFFFLV